MANSFSDAWYKAKEEFYETREGLRIDEVALGVVLRTDVNNVASMKLFCREGFAPVKDAEGCEMMDPEYPTRIYLWRT